MPEYHINKNTGMIVKHHKGRVRERNEAFASGIAPRDSETNDEIKNRSLFISGANWICERDCWAMVNHLSEIDGVGCLEDGRVECGNVQRDPENMQLKGAMFVRCCNANAAQ